MTRRYISMVVYYLLSTAAAAIYWTYSKGGTILTEHLWSRMENVPPFILIIAASFFATALWINLFLGDNLWKRFRIAALFFVWVLAVSTFHAVLSMQTTTGILRSLREYPKIQIKWPVTGCRGRIDSLVSRSGDFLRFDLQVSDIQWNGQWLKARGLFRMYAPDFRIMKKNGIPAPKDGPTRLRAGDMIEIHAEIPLFPTDIARIDGFSAYFARLGYDGSAFIQTPGRIRLLKDKTDRACSVCRFFSDTRNAVRDMIGDVYERRLSPATASLTRALLLSDSSAMDPEKEEWMRKSGTIHLLSASGLHLTVLFGMLYLLVGRIRYGSRYAMPVMFGTGLVYLYINGFRISLVRAFMLAALPIAGRSLFGRRTDPRQNLALAALSILVVEPREFFSLGFLFSFSAVAGILWLSPMFEKLVTAWLSSVVGNVPSGNFAYRLVTWTAKPFRFALSGLIVSYCAGFGIVLLQWDSFGSWQPISVLLNILAVPVGSLLVVLAFISLPLFAMCTAWGLPDLWAAPVAGWMETGAALLFGISKAGAGFPPVLQSEATGPWLFLSVPVLAAWLVDRWFRRKRRQAYRQRISPSKAPYLGALPVACIVLFALIGMIKGYRYRLIRPDAAVQRSEIKATPSSVYWHSNGQRVWIGRARELTKSGKDIDLWVIPRFDALYVAGYDHILDRQPTISVMFRYRRRRTFLFRRFYSALKKDKRRRWIHILGNSTAMPLLASTVYILQPSKHRTDGGVHPLLSGTDTLQTDRVYRWMVLKTAGVLRIWDMREGRDRRAMPMMPVPDGSEAVWVHDPAMLRWVSKAGVGVVGPRRVLLYTGRRRYLRSMEYTEMSKWCVPDFFTEIPMDRYIDLCR